MSEHIATRAEVVATLTVAWRALSDVGAGLTERQWKTPTDLPGWSVQDTLSHVIGTERSLEELPGEEPLPDDQPSHVRNLIGEINEREVAARRTHSGAEVLAEWDELRAVREHTLSAPGDEYFEQPMNTPTGPGTMTDFLAVRILDCWVHEQDIRRALGLAGTFDGGAAAHTVDRLTSSLPMVVGKRGACPEGAAVEIQLTGPVARRFVCEVTNGRAAFVEMSSDPALATITMDTESYVLFATGRRSPAELAERITVEGDEGLASRILGGMNVLI